MQRSSGSSPLPLCCWEPSGCPESWLIPLLRAQEFGIRAALGATPGNVRWLVLRQSAKLAISGLIAGMLAFLGLGRLLSGFLFGVKPGDPGIYAAVILVLTFPGSLP
jgi:ABC-type antimicrobial peptide transport system permease subunit